MRMHIRCETSGTGDMCGIDVLLLTAMTKPTLSLSISFFPALSLRRLILTMKAECYSTPRGDSSHPARREANLDLVRAKGNRSNCGRPVD